MSNLTQNPQSIAYNQCPHCRGKVVYTNNRVVYHEPFGNGRCYYCLNCGAFIGVTSTKINGHDQATRTPLGQLANPEMVYWKRSIRSFLRLFSEQQQIPLAACATTLAHQLQLSNNELNLNWLDHTTLRQAITLINQPTWPDIDVVTVLQQDQIAHSPRNWRQFSPHARSKAASQTE